MVCAARRQEGRRKGGIDNKEVGQEEGEDNVKRKTRCTPKLGPRRQGKTKENNQQGSLTSPDTACLTPCSTMWSTTSSPTFSKNSPVISETVSRISPVRSPRCCFPWGSWGALATVLFIAARALGVSWTGLALVVPSLWFVPLCGVDVFDSRAAFSCVLLTLDGGGRAVGVA